MPYMPDPDSYDVNLAREVLQGVKDRSFSDIYTDIERRKARKRERERERGRERERDIEREREIYIYIYMADASKCAPLFGIFIYKTGEILKFLRFFSRPILVARFWPVFRFFVKNPLRFPVLEPFLREGAYFPCFEPFLCKCRH